MVNERTRGGAEPDAPTRPGDEPLVWGEPLARALVAHSADVIMVLTADHRCRFVSPAVERVLGYAPDDVLGAEVIPLHHPDDLSRAVAMLVEAAANPGQPAQAEVRLRHQDGAWRWLAVVATNRLDDPAIGGIVCNLHDVTERTEAALATEAALRTQEVANRELRRVSQAKSDLMAIVSHEIRTPLTVITGYADLLQWEPGERPQVLDYARTIGSEAARLSRLTDDLLLLARIESAQLVLHRQPIDLNLLVAEEVERLRAIEPGREFRFELDRGLPPAEADPERIAQVIANIVGNAIKYSPGGGPITISTARDGDVARLDIADEGIGIPAAMLPTIFDRFRRVEQGAARTIQGTGLGLSIVRQLVHVHGGRAWAESEEGAGSVFHVTLPLASPG